MRAIARRYSKFVTLVTATRHCSHCRSKIVLSRREYRTAVGSSAEVNGDYSSFTRL